MFKNIKVLYFELKYGYSYVLISSENDLYVK